MAHVATCNIKVLFCDVYVRGPRNRFGSCTKEEVEVMWWSSVSVAGDIDEEGWRAVEVWGGGWEKKFKPKREQAGPAGTGGRLEVHITTTIILHLPAADTAYSILCNQQSGWERTRQQEAAVTKPQSKTLYFAESILFPFLKGFGICVQHISANNIQNSWIWSTFWCISVRHVGPEDQLCRSSVSCQQHCSKTMSHMEAQRWLNAPVLIVLPSRLCAPLDALLTHTMMCKDAHTSVLICSGAQNLI